MSKHNTIFHANISLSIYLSAEKQNSEMKLYCATILQVFFLFC